MGNIILLKDYSIPDLSVTLHTLIISFPPGVKDNVVIIKLEWMLDSESFSNKDDLEYITSHNHLVLFRFRGRITTEELLTDQIYNVTSEQFVDRQIYSSCLLACLSVCLSVGVCGTLFPASNPNHSLAIITTTTSKIKHCNKFLPWLQTQKIVKFLPRKYVFFQFTHNFDHSIVLMLNWDGWKQAHHQLYGIPTLNATW